jgi:hypothetical protein
MWALSVVCGKEGLEEVGEGEGFIRDLESEVEDGEICMYSRQINVTYSYGSI